MTDPTDGGTVRYRRADWVAERDRWVVTFPNGRVQGFTAEQGEAMGLTSPEPEAAPLAVTCNGHSVDLSDDTARTFIDYWSTCEPVTRYEHAASALAGLLRDARQDPQPASGADIEPRMMQSVWPSTPGTATHALDAESDPYQGDPVPASADRGISEPWPWGDEGYMCPKMVRETLCVAQAAVGRSPEVDARRVEHVERISRLINLCDRHRPLGPDGKHGTRQCTPTCGCEDKREPTTPVQPASDTDPEEGRDEQ